MLFTNFYANGHRSQQGLSAIISGFPPTPVYDITHNFEKYPHLNSMVQDLNQLGYHSSFYFGGDLVYGNLKAYMMANQFDRVIDEKSLPAHFGRGKLTIYDEHLLTYHIEEMNKEQEPFFSMVFTGSTHSPYDEPKIVEQLTWNCPEIDYLNSAKYTDYSLKKYFDLVKKEAWYERTLFILVADHSHRTHLQRDYHSPEYQHIPMLWVGGAIAEEYRGTTYEKLASQVDIPKTLLHQLHLSADNYQWSNDIFNPYTQEFAAFETLQGINWIRKDIFLRYDGFKNYFYPTTFAEDSILQQEQLYTKAFLQQLYQQYLDF
ncbi:MAG: LTA synthase family protein [Sphaerochaetaceae bacterium]